MTGNYYLVALPHIATSRALPDEAVLSQNETFRQAAKNSNNQATVYLFTDGESVLRPLMGLFTFCTSSTNFHPRLHQKAAE